MKQKLTIEKFLDFQEQLQKEILNLEVLYFKYKKIHSVLRNYFIKFLKYILLAVRKKKS